jgi:hypothetical protein
MPFPMAPLLTCPTRDLIRAAGVYLVLALVWFPGVLWGQVLSQVDMLYFWLPWDAVRPEGLGAPGNPVLSDQTREFWIFFQIARESFANLQFPLWNPYIFAGTPLLANTQSALLFPLNLAHYLVPAWGFTASAIGKLLLAGTGLYVLCRSLRMDHGPALVGGAIYAFAAINIFWLNHPHTNVTALFPWALWAAYRLALEPDSRKLAVLAVIVGLQLLAGHVEIAFLTAIAVGIFYLAAVLEMLGWRRIAPRAAQLFGAYVLGLGLAAVMVIPFVEFLANSATWDIRGEQNFAFLSPAGLLSWLTPEVFSVSQIGDVAVAYQAISLYVGFAALVFAGFAIATDRSGARWVLLVLTALGLVMVFKVQPVFWLLTQLPLLRETPAYYFVVFPVISVALLAAIGVQFLVERAYILRWEYHAVAWGSILLALSLALFVPAVRDALGNVAGVSGDDAMAIAARLQGWIARAVVILIACISLPWLLRRLPAFRSLAFPLVLVLCLLPGWWHMRHWNPVVDPAWTEPQIPSVLAELAQEPGPFRIVALRRALPTNTAVLAGLQDLRGYDVPVVDRYHRFFLEAVGGRASFWDYSLHEVTPEGLRALGLLNVRYLLSPQGMALPLAQTALADGLNVYANPAVRERAWFAGEAQYVEDGDEALAAVMDPGRVPGSVVIEGGVADGTHGGSGDVRVEHYSARRVDLRVESEGPGHVVLADTWYPGWSATVDGRKVEVLRADYLLRAVAVPGGEHTLSFRYRPWSFMIGAALSLISVLITVWLLRNGQKSS